MEGLYTGSIKLTKLAQSLGRYLPSAITYEVYTMSAQAALQSQVTVKKSVETSASRAEMKPVAPVMREVPKSAPKVEEPRYDFVGIAG